MVFTTTIHLSDTSVFNATIREMQAVLQIIEKLEAEFINADGVLGHSNITNFAVKSYIRYEELAKVLDDFRALKITINGKQPDTNRIRDLILAATPNEDLDQIAIDLAHKIYYDLNNKNGYMPIYIAKSEKGRYMKNYKKFGYENINEFVKSALNNQYLLDVAKLLDDKDVEEFF